MTGRRASSVPAAVSRVDRDVGGTAAGDGSAVVVTCRVPVELRTLFAFTPGQHVTAKAVLDGKSSGARIRCVRRRAELASLGSVRIGVRVVPGGTFSTYLGRVLTSGDVLDVLPPVGNFVTTLDPQRPTLRRNRRGSGITPCCRWWGRIGDRAKQPLHRAVRQPIHRFNDARRRIGRLKNRYPERLHLLHAFSAEDPKFGLPGGAFDRDMLHSIFDRILEPTAVREWFCAARPVWSATHAES